MYYSELIIEILEATVMFNDEDGLLCLFSAAILILQINIEEEV